MNVILLENIERLGAKYDVVKVRDGYGRNYLIPRGLAIVANRTNLARIEGLKKQAAKKEAALLNTFREYAAKLEATLIRVKAKAGESGRLFGSVTAQQLADEIQAQTGIAVDRRIIEMPDEVKELGFYEARIKFHAEVAPIVRFEVVSEGAQTTGD
ncbi:MAG: 50S ribosomal protein L9 [Saprospiraceae bacterium]|nr:50S ribosomal protein L9 [Saprospiraceae bacterium]MDW8483780.1 50S ribosomal protein L9 [Saprospiraceae bacterium]